MGENDIYGSLQSESFVFLGKEGNHDWNGKQWICIRMMGL